MRRWRAQSILIHRTAIPDQIDKEVLIIVLVATRTVCNAAGRLK